MNSEPIFPVKMRLNLDQVVCYRWIHFKYLNRSFKDLKKEIRVNGISNPLSVKRVGDRLIIQDGASRYLILKELWHETGDRKYFEFDCFLDLTAKEITTGNFPSLGCVLHISVLGSTRTGKLFTVTENSLPGGDQ